MKNSIITWVIGVVAVLALTISIGNSVGNNSQPEKTGDSGSRYPNGISADTTSPVEGQIRGTDLLITDDATISGGSFTVTTSNLATSSTSLGCIQSTATSTETPIRFIIALATSATTTYQGTPSDGFVVWQYGSCPA